MMLKVVQLRHAEPHLTPPQRLTQCGILELPSLRRPSFLIALYPTQADKLLFFLGFADKLWLKLIRATAGAAKHQI